MQRRKLTSWFLTICLSVTQVLSPDIVQAAALQVSASSESVKLEHWNPSAELGRIVKRVSSDNSHGTLIHIQDAHAVLHAQKNIQALAHEIEKQISPFDLLVEGGAGDLDPRMRHFSSEGISLSAEQREAWMTAGHLTGAEAYLMESRKVRGYGMEEVTSYWDNVEVYRRVDSQRNESDAFLQAWQNEWQQRAAAVLKPAIKKYLEHYARAQKESKEFTVWLDALRDYLAKEWNRNLGDAHEQLEFPMLARYVYLKKIDGALDFAKIENQKNDFFLALTGIQSRKGDGLKAAFAEVDALLEKSKSGHTDFSAARNTFEKLVPFLPENFSLTAWPDFKKWAERIILSSEMDVELLQAEARKLHGQIIQKDAREPAAKKLAISLEKHLLLAKLLHLEISRAEFKKLLNKKITPSGLAWPVKNEEAQQALQNIESIFMNAVHFYQGAIAREKHFAESMHARLKKKTNRSLFVAVTGGFHAAGVEAFARKNNLNYVGVVPRIAEITSDDFARYHRALLGEGSALGIADAAPDAVSQVAAALLTSAKVFEDPRAAVREQSIWDLPGASQAFGKSNRHTSLRWKQNSPQMKGSATRPRQSDRPMTEWEGARARPSARSESRLQEAMEKMDAWKARHNAPYFLERYDADPFMTKLEAQAALLYKQYRLNELSVRDRAEFVQRVFQDVQPAVSDYVAGWLDDIAPAVLDSADPIDYLVFQKVSSNMASLEYRYSLAQNQMIRTAGNLVFDLSEQEKRFFELEYLLHEFDKEIENPGSGNIPVVAAMQDLHGGTRRALGLIAKLYGLPPDSFKKIRSLNDLKQLLDESNLSTSMLSGRVIGFSDLVDRGDDPVGSMELAREFTQNSLGRFILGNHDLWRMMGVLGVHQLFEKTEEADFEENEKGDHPAWWAWEAFHHAGWGDRELEQLNERRINARIREVNKQIEHYNQTSGAEAKALLSELDLESFGEELNKKLKEAKKKNEVTRAAWQKAVVDEDKAALAEQRPKKPIAEPQFVALPDVFKETLNYVRLKLEQKQKAVELYREQGAVIDSDFRDIQVVNRDNYQQDRDVLSNMLWQAQKFRLFYIDILGNLHMHNIIPMDYEAGGMAVHYRGFDGIAALELMTKDIREFFETVTVDDLLGAPEKVNEFRRRMWTAIGEALTLINSWYSDRVPVAKAIAVQRFIEEGNIEWYLGSAGSFVDREISGVVFWGHNEAKKFVEANLARILIYPNHGSGLINIDGGMSKGYDNRGMEVTFGLRDEKGQVQGLQTWGYHPKGADLDTETVVDLTRSEEITSSMSPEQRVLLGHLAHGPTYLRWQRHKILMLLDRGLDSFLRTPAGQKREKVIKLRKLWSHVHERLKKDRDPLKVLGASRAEGLEIAGDAAGRGVDLLELEHIGEIKTWKEVFEFIEKILAAPQNDLSLAALKRVILKIRLNGADFEMARENSYSDYSDDIYEKARELTEKVIQKYQNHPEVVRHFVFAMPFDLDQSKKGKRDLWGLAADFDDRWMRDEDGGETGYANTLRRLIHRAGFSFSKALELIRVYIEYLTSESGSWEPVRQAAIVNFPSKPDKDLRAQIQKKLAEGMSPDAIDDEPYKILLELREKLTVAQNGIRRKEFFERWQQSLLANTYPELQPWIVRILNPRHRGDEVAALNEAMSWISNELALKPLSPELKYEQIQFYQSLGSLLQDLAASRLSDIGTLSEENQYQRIAELISILQPMLYRLREQGYLTRDSKDWIASLKEQTLQLDQVHDLLQKIREDIAFFNRDFFQAYGAEARFLFSEEAVTVETALNMLLKEELEIKLADQLIEELTRTIYALPAEYKKRRASFAAATEGPPQITPVTSDEQKLVFFSHPDRWLHQNARRVWGGEKAAVLALARNRLGLPVPPGFVVSADVFMNDRSSEAEKQFQAGLIQGVRQIENEWKTMSSESLAFGDAERPLFLALRSGSTFVMPGQLATFIMVGMSRAIYKKMTESANPKEGHLAYYYFLFSAAELLGLSADELNVRVQLHLDSHGGARIQDLNADDMKLLILAMETFFTEKNLKKELDELLRVPESQIALATKRIRDSWSDSHAMDYRVQNHISDAWGTPLIVQKYVLGSFEKKSGSGLARSRNNKGERVITGDWLASTQGYDLVSGFQTPQGLESLEEGQPAVYDQLRQIVDSLDSYFGRPVLVEFTVSQGRLWILQISRDKSVKSLKLPSLYAKGLSQRMIMGQGVPVYASGGGFRGAVIYDLASTLNEQNQLKPEWIDLIQEQKVDGLIWVVESMTPKKTALMLAGKKALEAKGFRLAIVSSEGGVLSHAASSAAENEVPAVVGVQQIRVTGGKLLVFGGAALLPKTNLTIKFDNGTVYFGRQDLDLERPDGRSEVRHASGFADGRLIATGGLLAAGFGLLHAVLGDIGFRIALGWGGLAVVVGVFIKVGFDIWKDIQTKKSKAPFDSEKMRTELWSALDRWPKPAVGNWLQKEDSAVADLTQIRDKYVLGALYLKRAAEIFQDRMDAGRDAAVIAQEIKNDLKAARDQLRRVDYDRDAGILLNALNRIDLSSSEPSPSLIHFVEFFILARLRSQPRQAWNAAPIPQGGYLLGANPTSADLKNYPLPSNKKITVFLLPGQNPADFKRLPLYRDLKANKNKIRLIRLQKEDYASRAQILRKIRQIDAKRTMDVLITPFSGLMPEKNNPYPAGLQRYFEDAKDLYEVETGKRVDQIFYETDLIPTLANYFVQADEKAIRLSSQSLSGGHETQEYRTPYSIITALMAFVAGTLGWKRGILKDTGAPIMADAFYRTGIYGDERPQQPNEPSKLRRIFLVSPHPDDDVIAAKAILAQAMKLAQEGEVVAEVIVMQPGENGVVDLNEAQMKEALRMALGYETGDLNAARVDQLKKVWAKNLNEIRTLHENVLAEYKERYPAAAEKFRAKLETFKGVDFDALFDAAANQAWNYEELAKSGIQKKEINQATQALLKETAKYFIRRIENQRAIDFFNDAYPGKIRAQFFPEFLGYPSSGPQDLRFIHELEEHAAVVMQHLLMKFERSIKDAPKEAVISIVAPHRVDSHPHHVGSWKVISDAMKLWSTQSSRQSSRDVEVLYYFAPWSGNLPAYHLSPQTKKSTNADLLRALIAGELTASRFGLPSPKELNDMQAQRYLVRPSILPARSEMRTAEESVRFLEQEWQALERSKPILNAKNNWRAAVNSVSAFEALWRKRGGRESEFDFQLFAQNLQKQFDALTRAGRPLTGDDLGVLLGGIEQYKKAWDMLASHLIVTSRMQSSQQAAAHSVYLAAQDIEIFWKKAIAEIQPHLNMKRVNLDRKLAAQANGFVFSVVFGERIDLASKHESLIAKLTAELDSLPNMDLPQVFLTKLQALTDRGWSVNYFAQTEPDFDQQNLFLDELKTFLIQLYLLITSSDQTFARSKPALPKIIQILHFMHSYAREHDANWPDDWNSDAAGIRESLQATRDELQQFRSEARTEDLKKPREFDFNSKIETLEGQLSQLERDSLNDKLFLPDRIDRKKALSLFVSGVAALGLLLNGLWIPGMIFSGAAIYFIVALIQKPFGLPDAKVQTLFAVVLEALSELANEFKDAPLDGSKDEKLVESWTEGLNAFQQELLAHKDFSNRIAYQIAWANSQRGIDSARAVIAAAARSESRVLDGKAVKQALNNFASAIERIEFLQTAGEKDAFPGSFNHLKRLRAYLNKNERGEHIDPTIPLLAEFKNFQAEISFWTGWARRLRAQSAISPQEMHDFWIASRSYEDELLGWIELVQWYQPESVEKWKVVAAQWSNALDALYSTLGIQFREVENDAQYRPVVLSELYALDPEKMDQDSLMLMLETAAENVSEYSLVAATQEKIKAFLASTEKDSGHGVFLLDQYKNALYYEMIFNPASRYVLNLAAEDLMSFWHEPFSEKWVTLWVTEKMAIAQSAQQTHEFTVSRLSQAGFTKPSARSESRLIPTDQDPARFSEDPEVQNLYRVYRELAILNESIKPFYEYPASIVIETRATGQALTQFLGQLKLLSPEAHSLLFNTMADYFRRDSKQPIKSVRNKLEEALTNYGKKISRSGINDPDNFKWAKGFAMLVSTGIFKTKLGLTYGNTTAYAEAFESDQIAPLFEKVKQGTRARVFGMGLMTSFRTEVGALSRENQVDIYSPSEHFVYRSLGFSPAYSGRNDLLSVVTGMGLDGFEVIENEGALPVVRFLFKGEIKNLGDESDDSMTAFMLSSEPDQKLFEAAEQDQQGAYERYLKYFATDLNFLKKFAFQPTDDARDKASKTAGLIRFLQDQPGKLLLNADYLLASESGRGKFLSALSETEAASDYLRKKLAAAAVSLSKTVADLEQQRSDEEKNLPSEIEARLDYLARVAAGQIEEEQREEIEPFTSLQGNELRLLLDIAELFELANDFLDNLSSRPVAAAKASTFIGRLMNAYPALRDQIIAATFNLKWSFEKPLSREALAAKMKTYHLFYKATYHDGNPIVKTARQAVVLLRARILEQLYTDAASPDIFEKPEYQNEFRKQIRRGWRRFLIGLNQTDLVIPSAGFLVRHGGHAFHTYPLYHLLRTGFKPVLYGETLAAQMQSIVPVFAENVENTFDQKMPPVISVHFSGLIGNQLGFEANELHFFVLRNPIPFEGQITWSQFQELFETDAQAIEPLLLSDHAAPEEAEAWQARLLGLAREGKLLAVHDWAPAPEKIDLLMEFLHLDGSDSKHARAQLDLFFTQQNRGEKTAATINQGFDYRASLLEYRRNQPKQELKKRLMVYALNAEVLSDRLELLIQATEPEFASHAFDLFFMTVVSAKSEQPLMKQEQFSLLIEKWKQLQRQDAFKTWAAGVQDQFARYAENPFYEQEIRLQAAEGLFRQIAQVTPAQYRSWIVDLFQKEGALLMGSVVNWSQPERAKKFVQTWALRSKKERPVAITRMNPDADWLQSGLYRNELNSVSSASAALWHLHSDLILAPVLERVEKELRQAREEDEVLGGDMPADERLQLKKKIEKLEDALAELGLSEDEMIAILAGQPRVFSPESENTPNRAQIAEQRAQANTEHLQTQREARKLLTMIEQTEFDQVDPGKFSVQKKSLSIKLVSLSADHPDVQAAKAALIKKVDDYIQARLALPYVRDRTYEFLVREVSADQSWAGSEKADVWTRTLQQHRQERDNQREKSLIEPRIEKMKAHLEGLLAASETPESIQVWTEELLEMIVGSRPILGEATDKLTADVQKIASQKLIEWLRFNLQRTSQAQIESLSLKQWGEAEASRQKARDQILKLAGGTIAEELTETGAGLHLKKSALESRIEGFKTKLKERIKSLDEIDFSVVTRESFGAQVQEIRDLIEERSMWLGTDSSQSFQANLKAKQAQLIPFVELAQQIRAAAEKKHASAADINKEFQSLRQRVDKLQKSNSSVFQKLSQLIAEQKQLAEQALTERVRMRDEKKRAEAEKKAAALASKPEPVIPESSAVQPEEEVLATAEVESAAPVSVGFVLPQEINLDEPWPQLPALQNEKAEDAMGYLDLLTSAGLAIESQVDFDKPWSFTSAVSSWIDLILEETVDLDGAAREEFYRYLRYKLFESRTQIKGPLAIELVNYLYGKMIFVWHKREEDASLSPDKVEAAWKSFYQPGLIQKLEEGLNSYQPESEKRLRLFANLLESLKSSKERQLYLAKIENRPKELWLEKIGAWDPLLEEIKTRLDPKSDLNATAFPALAAYYALKDQAQTYLEATLDGDAAILKKIGAVESRAESIRQAAIARHGSLRQVLNAYQGAFALEQILNDVNQRSEARSSELSERLPPEFEHRDFWVNEVRALENAEEPILIPRNAIEFPAGDRDIKRSPGYSATVFLNEQEAGHREVIQAIGAVQSQIQKLFSDLTLLVPADALHVTIKGIQHGIDGELSLAAIQEFHEKISAVHSANGAARGKLVGPVWHRSLGVVMIYVPESEDVLSAVKVETETALNLSREPRPFHMTLAYLPASRLSTIQIQEIQAKINSIPLQTIPVEFNTAEVNGYENVAFTEMLRDPKAILQIQRSEARFSHPALKYGRRLDDAVTVKTEGLSAEMYEFRGQFYLLVEASNSKQPARGRISINTAAAFSKTGLFYILRDRFPAFAARQLGTNRPSENDPIYIRTQNELKDLPVILGPGQMHFFEIIRTDSKRVSAYHQILGKEASEFSSLGFFEEQGSLVSEQRVLRIDDSGRLVQLKDLNSDFTMVDPETGLRFYTGDQIERALKSTSNYSGEWQIYNPRGGKIRLTIKNGDHSENLEINERGAVVIKNLAPDTVIEWADVSGAEFMVVSDRDPDWFKPITDKAFDGIRETIITERNGIRSTEWMESVGVMGIALSRKQDFKWDELSGRQPTQWAVSAQTQTYLGGKEGFPTHGGSLIQEVSPTESPTTLRAYDEIYPGEQIHSHRSNLAGAKAMELYYIAEGAVGFYIEVNGHRSFLKAQAGDVLVVDPHVIHGIVYVNLPYAHAAVQAPSIWAMANLKGEDGKYLEFKQFLGKTADWLAAHPQEAAQMRYLMQSAPSGNYAIGEDFGAERGGTGLEKQEAAFKALNELFEKELKKEIDLADPPIALRHFLTKLAMMPRNDFENLYGTARIQSIMFLILLLAPESFEYTIQWDREFSEKLLALKAGKHAALFEKGTLKQQNTKNPYAKVLTLSNDDEALIIPFYFGLFAHPDQAERVIRNKIWTGKTAVNLGLNPTAKYKITDLFAIVRGGGPAVYGEQYTGKQIESGRDFGIPLLQGEDRDAEQPTLYPYAFFQVLEIEKISSARSEIRGEQPSAVQVMTARVFAAGFLPVGVVITEEILAEVMPAGNLEDRNRHAQSMLGLSSVQPDDVFILGADLALDEGYFAVIEHRFTNHFTVIAQGEKAREVQGWISNRRLAARVSIADDVKQAKTKWAGKRLVGLELVGGFETNLEDPIRYTVERLKTVYKELGLLDEIGQLVEFTRSFLASA